MPAIHPHKDHQRFVKLNEEAAVMEDKNMCAVIAAAVITGLDYKTCFEAFERAGRVKGKGTLRSVQKAAFDDLGYDCIDYDLKHIKARYKGAHSKLKYFTTYHPIRFAYAWHDVPDLYMQGPSHAAAFKGGKVIDWSNDKKVRVNKAWVIKKRGAAKEPEEARVTISMTNQDADALAWLLSFDQSSVDQELLPSVNRVYEELVRKTRAVSENQMLP